MMLLREHAKAECDRYRAGAIAITGVTIINTISGITARSTISNSLITIAAKKPKMIARASPNRYLLQGD